LLLRFDGAGAPYDDDAVAADRDAGGELDDGVLRPPLARDLLVGLRDVDDLRDAGQCFDPGGVDASIISDETDGGALSAGHRPRLVTHLLNDTDNAIDVFRRRVVRHDD